MQGKVEICGVNTSKLQTLSNAEMMQLIERSQQGDMEARSRLVEGNLKLVLSVVQRFLSRGENPDDLFQVGCIGLIKAIDNFDPSQKVRFSTYGVPMICGEVKRYLRDNNAVRVSRLLGCPRTEAAFLLVKQVVDDPEPQFGQIPTECGAGVVVNVITTDTAAAAGFGLNLLCHGTHKSGHRAGHPDAFHQVADGGTGTAA